MVLSCTVSKIDDDFSWKSQNFPTHSPCILHPHWRGCPWNWVSVLGSKNEKHGATEPRKKFDIFSSMDTIYQCDRWTDRWTDTGCQQRPRLRIASCGKEQIPPDYRLKPCLNYQFPTISFSTNPFIYYSLISHFIQASAKFHSLHCTLVKLHSSVL